MKVTYIEATGVVTGINRGAVEGELELNITPQELVWGMDSGLYTVVDGVFTPLTKDQKEALDIHKQAEADLKAQIDQINAEYAVNKEAPVEVTVPEGTFTFNGGQDSANSIKGGLDLAIELDEPEVYLWDVNNKLRPFSLDSANEIVVAIGKAYRDAAYKRLADIDAVLDPQPEEPEIV